MIGKNRLYFTIGLARSGKSSLCYRWVNHHISFDNTGRTIQPLYESEPRVVICADEWRLAMGHRFNSYVEPLVHSQVRIAVRALLRNHNVMVDETNTNEYSIIQWLEEDIDAIPIFVNTPLEVCKKRALDTKQPDLIPVLDRMYMNLVNTFGSTFDIEGTIKKIKERAMIRRALVRIAD